MRRALTLLLIVLIAGMSFAALAFDGRAPRLIVDNRMASLAAIDVWRYNGTYWEWMLVVYVQSGQYVPISPVNPGERFRARFQRQSDGPQQHIVTLYYDSSYGGLQDIWLLNYPANR